MTSFHRKICELLRGLTEERGLWLKTEDVCYSMKPLKMGIRVCNLIEDWDGFVEHYDRLTKTCELLYRLELTPEERKNDLE